MKNTNILTVAILKFSSIIVILSLMIFWEICIRYYQVPQYILPSPTFIIITLVNDWPILLPAMTNTLEVAFLGFLLASTGGIFIALVMSYSKIIQSTVLPLAIILQVTPIVAIAPLIVIYVDSTKVALLLCVWLVAFFPVLTNSIFGLNTINADLIDLFKLYRASKFKTLVHLRIPNSIPSIVAGLKVSAGLSLIGAIVAEFAAGSGGSESGLAFRILEAGYRLNIPRMFACLFLLAIIGIFFHKFIEFTSQRILIKYTFN
jgi:NitT/TauT family transport system permease protein